MVQAQGVFGSSEASARVGVDGEPVIPLPIIIGLGILGLAIAAIVLKK